jgi:hypothetical protein
MNPILWRNVSVLFQSAIASAITITGISKADPGVVTHGGADPTNGNFVLIRAEGMRQVDGRLFRVAGVSAGVSFTLEGEDTTLYDTFSSGTFEVVTIDTPIQVIGDVAVGGGEAQYTDVGTIHDDRDKNARGNFSAQSMSWDCHYDLANAGLQALFEASRVEGSRGVLFTFSDGRKTLAYGDVAASEMPSGSRGGRVVTPVGFNIPARVTGYAT